jgi:octanoyl-[GcvH]:protein N-octanoyltransferase
VGTPTPSLTLVVDREIREPLRDIAIGPAWMRELAAQGSGAALRIYRPQPTVAFSARDCRSPGIRAAIRSAEAAGFAAVRRGPGGRATAYHPGCIGIDHVAATPRGSLDIRARFAHFGEMIAGALRTLGVPAGVGEVPGEYCPGEFSVHDGSGRKLVGTAQRIVPGGWLFSSMVVVADAAALREVLVPVYRHLELALDPRAIGAVHDTAPGMPADPVEQALISAYATAYDLVPGELPVAVTHSADRDVDRFRPPA